MKILICLLVLFKGIYSQGELSFPLQHMFHVSAITECKIALPFPVFNFVALNLM